MNKEIVSIITPQGVPEVDDNSGCMDAENDIDEYFDKHEVEEYMSVVHNKNTSTVIAQLEGGRDSSS